jgi:hypothetical protein
MIKRHRIGHCKKFDNVCFIYKLNFLLVMYVKISLKRKQKQTKIKQYK